MNGKRQWLNYEREIIEELQLNDGLLVMGKGLGIERMFAMFVQMYCGSLKTLVLCLNVNEQFEKICKLLLNMGLDPVHLPQVIDNRFQVQERQQLYKKGGIYFITSRILVVDLLNERLDKNLLTGILIYDGHRVNETSIEAFIVRLYRQTNRQGFIKAFTEEPNALCSGFHKVEQILKHLFLRKVFLYPRFHVQIHQDLQGISTPQVYEIQVAFTKKMKQIQEAILVALEATLKELQKYTKNVLDITELTMEKALTRSFSTSIRKQLDPLRQPLKTKQLIGDLTTLRQLLTYLTRYDAISFYSFLLSHQTMNGQQRYPSPWLFTKAADQLLQSAKSRLYELNPQKKNTKSEEEKQQKDIHLVLECNPKWEALAQILEEIEKQQEEEEEKEEEEKQQQKQKQKQKQQQKNSSSTQRREGAKILIMVKDDRTCAQLREFLYLGGKIMMRKRFGHYLKQKETAILKKKTPLKQLSKEQQILFQMSKKYSIYPSHQDPSTTTTSTTTPTPTTTTTTAKKKNKRKRPSKQQEQVQEEEEEQEQDKEVQEQENPLICGQFHTDVVNTFGMSLEELERIHLEEEKKQNKQQHALLSSSFIATTMNSNSTHHHSTKKTKKYFIQEIYDGKNQVVLCSYHEIFKSNSLKSGCSFLEEFMPTYVILYDPNMIFVRCLEVFYASFYYLFLEKKQIFEIYFMLYEESAEQQTYLSEIQQEKKAFETLIHQKAHLFVPFHDHLLPKTIKNLPQFSMDTRLNKKKKNFFSIQVIVDLREFRSALPSLLHKESLQIQPVTLEVGDYILSPLICIERKSINDLFSSFSNGRLFHQIENMTRFYLIPILLIEFTQEKIFSLQDPNEISSEISSTNIISKMTLLILHFPTLRIIWSRSPYATVDIFKELKKGQEEPNMEQAVLIGTGQTTTGTNTNTNTNTNRERFYNQSSMDVLKKLPGINEHNYRKILERVNNLAELSQLTQEEMIQMIGKIAGKKLYTFFHTSL